MGRRSKLTPELTAAAVDLLAGGEYVETVCAALGIGESTWYRWLQRGEQADQQLTDDDRLADSLEAWDANQAAKDAGGKAPHRSKHLLWRRWPDRPYWEFREAVQKAATDAEREALHQLRAAGFGGQLVKRRTVEYQDRTETVEEWSRPQWQALAWFLERRHRHRWQRSSEMVHTLASESGESGRAQLDQLVADISAMRARRMAEPVDDDAEAV